MGKNLVQTALLLPPLFDGSRMELQFKTGDSVLRYRIERGASAWKWMKAVENGWGIDPFSERRS